MDQTESSAWTLYGKLPEPAEVNGAVSRLVVQGICEFICAYRRLTPIADETSLLNQLDAVARIAFWLKETVTIGSKTAPNRLVAAGSAAFVYDSLAQTVSTVKMSLAHIVDERSHARNAGNGSDSLAMKQWACDNARLLAASQVFLWTMQGIVNARTLETTDELPSEVYEGRC